MGSKEEIEGVRREIREITKRIVELLAERNEHVKKLAELKGLEGVPVIDREAERELRDYIEGECKWLGLDADAAQRIVTLLIDESVKQQLNVLSKAKKVERITHMDVFRRAKRLELEGREIIHLEVGEPDFGSPSRVNNRLSSAANEGFVRYGDAKGILKLRVAIAELLNEKFGVDLKPDNILVVAGGRFGVYLAASSVLRPGDEALIVDPSWPLYKQVVEMLHARNIVIESKIEDGWLHSYDSIESSCSRSSRMLFINYPNNPTGAVIRAKEMEELVELCRKKGLFLLSDEVYMDYCFTNDYASVLQYNYERALMLMSFSKSWGMTGYRIGFLVGSEELIDKAAKLQAMLLTCVPEFVQVAALEAIHDKETPKVYGSAIKERIDELCKALDSMHVEYAKPKGAMYVFPRFKIDGFDSAEFAMRLLERRGVAVAPGTAFGNYPDYIRLSAGTSVEKIKEGMSRIKEEIFS